MVTKKFTLNHAARCKCCGKFYSEPEPISEGWCSLACWMDWKHRQTAFTVSR